jgi:type IX secretion system PorP/SprF family membrane protein
MKKFYLSLFVFSAALSSLGQQDPQFTMWMFDRLSFNPAAAGMDRMHQVQAFHRDQWDGFERDPKTYLFNYNGYANVAGRTVGIGASFMTEVLGQEQNKFARLSASFHQPIGDNFLSGGIQVGLLSKSLGNSWIAIDPTDPNIPINGISQGGFDMAAGLMFYNPNKYYAGVSATHLPATALSDLGFASARHIYVMGGYNYELPNGLLLRSNALIKTDMKASPAIDVNANVLWNNQLWGGLAFRPGDAIAPMLGFQMDLNTIQKGLMTYEHGFKVGYSYDITLSEIRNYSAGSHELFLTYQFNIGKTPVRRISGDPRQL